MLPEDTVVLRSIIRFEAIELFGGISFRRRWASEVIRQTSLSNLYGSDEKLTLGIAVR